MYTGEQHAEAYRWRSITIRSNFELVFVSRNPPDSSKEICYGDLVTEILLRRSCYGDSVTETPTHFNPYRFRLTLSTTLRRLIPCKGFLARDIPQHTPNFTPNFCLAGARRERGRGKAGNFFLTVCRCRLS